MGEPSSAVWVYMTAGSMEEATRIGRALVAERLVACVNLVDGMRSLYWWNGGVQEDAEVVMVAKTRQDRVPALSDRVRELHSYDCPCVVALPVADGHRPFLDWIAAEADARAPRD